MAKMKVDYNMGKLNFSLEKFDRLCRKWKYRYNKIFFKTFHLLKFSYFHQVSSGIDVERTIAAFIIDLYQEQFRAQSTYASKGKMDCHFSFIEMEVINVSSFSRPSDGIIEVSCKKCSTIPYTSLVTKGC